MGVAHAGAFDEVGRECWGEEEVATALRGAGLTCTSCKAGVHLCYSRILICET